MQKVRMEDDPATVLRKLSLAKNDLISAAGLERSEKQEDKQLVVTGRCVNWGETATSVAKRLGLTQAGVSKSVSRGKEVVQEMNLKLLPD